MDVLIMIFWLWAIPTYVLALWLAGWVLFSHKSLKEEGRTTIIKVGYVCLVVIIILELAAHPLWRTAVAFNEWSSDSSSSSSEDEPCVRDNRGVC